MNKNGIIVGENLQFATPVVYEIFKWFKEIT